MGVTRAQSVFLPIWQDEFQSDYKSVSSLYSFGFGGSMLNCILGKAHRLWVIAKRPAELPANEPYNSTNNTQKVWIA